MRTLTPIGRSAAFFSVSLQNVRRVEFGVGGEGNEHDRLARRQSRLQFAHLPGHYRAGARAAGEDDVGNPDLAAQVRQRDDAARLVGQRKVGDGSIDEQPGGRPAELRSNETAGNAEDDQHQTSPDDPFDRACRLVHNHYGEGCVTGER